MRDNLKVKLTKAQVKKLEPLNAKIEEGFQRGEVGAILCQFEGDTLTCNFMPQGQAEAVKIILNTIE